MSLEIADERRALAHVELEAAEIVIGDGAHEMHGVLVDRQQSLLLRGDAHDRRRVRMDGGIDIRPCRQDAGMDYQPAAAQFWQTLLPRIAIEIELAKIGGGDLVEERIGMLDQEGVGLVGNAQAQMIVREVAGAVMRHDAVGGGEFEPRVPFHIADRQWIPRGLVEGLHAHRFSPLLPLKDRLCVIYKATRPT